MLVNFQALGCRLNEAEVETWASQFLQRGYRLTTEVADADVVVPRLAGLRLEDLRRRLLQELSTGRS